MGDAGQGNALLKEEHLRLIPKLAPVVEEVVPEELPLEVVKCEDTPKKPSTRYCIVGSWDNFVVPQEMTWDYRRQCYKSEAQIVRICGVGMASFQILLNGSWDTCLHPPERTAEGIPRQNYSVEG